MEKNETIRFRRVRWKVGKGFASLPGRLAMAEGSKIKSSRVRNVTFIPPHADLPALVLKEYRLKGVGAWIRALILGPPARREWRALEALKAASVPAPRAAAWGRRFFLFLPRLSYLATVALKNTCTLEDLLLSKRPLPAPRKILAENVGRLVRGMHDAGLRHKDLHAANILVDGEGKTYIVDLHQAVLGRRLSMEQRFRDLRALAGAFLVHGQKTDRLRFFRAYAENHPEIVDLTTTIKDLERGALRRLQRYMRKFDGRALRPGKTLQPLKIHDLGGLCIRGDDGARWTRRLGPHPWESLRERGDPIHDSGATKVYRVSTKDGDYAVKEYVKPGFLQGLKRLFNGSRARKSWLNYHRLIYRGFKTPRPVLYLEEPAFSPVGRSYLITEGAFHLPTLDRFVEHGDREAVHRLILRAAFTLARMHRLFLRNRDLKAQNLLVTPSLEILFIDPDGVHPVENPCLATSARDLMRLNASFPQGAALSMTDRLRFLNAYVSHMNMGASDRKFLWKEILLQSWDKWNRWTDRTP